MMLAAAGCGESAAPSEHQADADGDGVPAGADCNDDDASISEPIAYYLDADDDGRGGSEPNELCASRAPEGFSPESGDCDDQNAEIQAPPSYFVDGDADGFGAGNATQLCSTVAPGGYADNAEDCDDEDDALGSEVRYFVDGDLDGYGFGAGELFCMLTPPEGYALTPDDPNDDNASIVPADADGDGVANESDCNPENPNEYIEADYYADVDEDGIGAGAVASFCTSQPPAAITGYSLIDGDSCPVRPNAHSDIDLDGVDDVCDTAWRFLGYRVLTEDLFLQGANAYSEPMSYFVGQPGNAAHLIFEDATLTVAEELVMLGGSTLRLSKKTFSGISRLSLFPGAVVRGMGAGNGIELFGTRLVPGKRSSFSGLDEVFFTYTFHQKPGAPAGTYEYFPSVLSWLPDGWTHAELFRVENSKGSHAVVVQDQYLNLSNVVFVDNDGYPLLCRGRDYQHPRFQHRRRRTTCQTAYQYAYFENNRFNGPALQTVDELDQVTGILGEFYNDPAISSGATEIYVRDTTYYGPGTSLFRDVSIKPYQIIHRDLEGNFSHLQPMCCGSYDRVASFRFRGAAGAEPSVTFSNSPSQGLVFHVASGNVLLESAPWQPPVPVGTIWVDSTWSDPLSTVRVVVENAVIDMTSNLYGLRWNSGRPNDFRDGNNHGILLESHDQWHNDSITLRETTVIVDDTFTSPMESISGRELPDVVIGAGPDQPIVSQGSYFKMENTCSLEGGLPEDFLQVEQVGRNSRFYGAYLRGQ